MPPMKIEPVTDWELAILEVIWTGEAPTSREIAEAIYERVSDSKVASVQKLLERLESKGYVNRDRRERAHRFQAAIEQKEFLQHQMRVLADRHCGGSITPLVTALLRSKGISKKDRQQLRKLIDEQWPE
jgi:BlaI family transcriptional regulator, penicillinase repressor